MPDILAATQEAATQMGESAAKIADQLSTTRTDAMSQEMIRLHLMQFARSHQILFQQVSTLCDVISRMRKGVDIPEMPS